MRSTFKILFFLKRDKQKANGTVPLFCRITVDGQEARFGMKCDVNPKYWDVKTGRATGRTLEATKANALVDTTQAAIYKIYREMQERNNYVTAEKLKNVFLGHEHKQHTLLTMFDTHNEDRKGQVGVNLSKSTYEIYCIARNLYADFLSFKHNLTDIPLIEIDRQFLIDFETYMLGEHNYSKNYTICILSKLRHIINLAIDKELLYKSPFKDYPMQWQKGKRGFLTQSEIETLIDYQFDERRLEKSRDVFIFCAFTGLSYKDVKSLTYENIQTSIDGNLWIRGKRHKTDIEYNIPLLNIPKAILEKYKGKKPELALPVINLKEYNENLREAAKQCGIKKRMSSHLARHTFATLTLTKGVSIESISKMLGHTKIETTQIYAQITDNKIGSEMNVFAVNVRQLDAKMMTIAEIRIDDVLKSLKIAASDSVWKSLTTDVWGKMTGIDRQTFVAEVNSKENKPKTTRDFYIVLIDFFLKGLNNQNNNEKAFANVDFDMAVNF